MRNEKWEVGNEERRVKEHIHGKARTEGHKATY